jgi:imidazolonepropionase-like amidohydrolase
MGAEGEWGTLAAGRVANVVVVDGRPDQRIQDTRNVRMVMLRGQVLDREELRLR